MPETWHRCPHLLLRQDRQLPQLFKQIHSGARQK
jgi:hypothetical protein